MQRPAFPPNEDARLAALRALNLPARSEERFDQVTQLAAEIFQVPMAFVSFIEEDRQWFKSSVGLGGVQETPRELSFCAHAILGEEALFVPDARKDPRFADNPLVTGDPFLRAYMGQPLRLAGGEKVGTLCIADRVVRDFSPAQAQILSRLAGVVEQELRMGEVIDTQAELLDTQGALLKAQMRLSDELAEAAKYVRSLIPPPCAEPVAIDWRYLPSEQLGGDSLGYHFLEEKTVALYVLDICGHGVGAALLSVVLLDVLRSRALPGVDFSDPAAVLEALNREFPFQRHGRFFTIWYGVLDLAQRQLTFSTAGHPPAVLVGSGGEISLLSTRGMATGCMIDAQYENRRSQLQPNDSLYVYSDGAYELRNAVKEMLSVDDLALIFKRATAATNPLDEVLKELRRRGGSETFADDVSLLAVKMS
ncbi:MAG: GAF domain-containing SpoIIE family protein phosphatase [Chthoniobacterales bacterium]